MILSRIMQAIFKSIKATLWIKCHFLMRTKNLQGKNENFLFSLLPISIVTEYLLYNICYLIINYLTPLNILTHVPQNIHVRQAPMLSKSFIISF